MKPLMRQRVEVCGHARYLATTDDGLKLCICATCGHRWCVALTPDGKEDS